MAIAIANLLPRPVARFAASDELVDELELMPMAFNLTDGEVFLQSFHTV
ncbi:MAG: hypothetical protein QGG42_11240 [Phycisphaerae bacterium]|jgi:hypothetical protein|nr:hypothetical protein [Phycisphaerae bacterium]